MRETGAKRTGYSPWRKLSRGTFHECDFKGAFAVCVDLLQKTIVLFETE